MKKNIDIVMRAVSVTRHCCKCVTSFVKKSAHRKINWSCPVYFPHKCYILSSLTDRGNKLTDRSFRVFMAKASHPFLSLPSLTSRCFLVKMPMWSLLLPEGFPLPFDTITWLFSCFSDDLRPRPS